MNHDLSCLPPYQQTALRHTDLDAIWELWADNLPIGRPIKSSVFVNLAREHLIATTSAAPKTARLRATYALNYFRQPGKSDLHSFGEREYGWLPVDEDETA